MKKRVIMLIIITLILGLSIDLIIGIGSSYSLYDISDEEALNSYNLLNNSLDETKARNTYYDYINEASVKYGNNNYQAEMTDGINDTEYGYNGETITVLSYTDYVDYKVDVKEEGYYNLSLDIFILDRPLSNYNLSIQVNGAFLFDESERIDVPILWEDATKTFPLDTYGDETQPQSNKINESTKKSM